MTLSPTRTISLSVVVALVVFGLKFLAYRLTGSVALYSDALESIINVVAALVALAAIGVAKRPPDANHPYGHSKAEYLSAVLEGVLIVLAAIAIVNEAAHKLMNPAAPGQIGIGLLVSLGASGLNAALGSFLIANGRRQRSPALVADGQHVLADVYTSGGVLLGIGLAWLTGWWILDPLLAIAVALNILWVGWRLTRDSVGGLMDEGVPEVELSDIQDTLTTTLQRLTTGKVLEVHDLRTRRAGPRTFVEFHLVVPGEMTVEEAHRICDQLEDSLRTKVEGTQVTIHVEPEWKAEHKGFVVRSR
ncbi:MAG: cation-efflux pump [Meiothermus sp.]